MINYGVARRSTAHHSVATTFLTVGDGFVANLQQTRGRVNSGIAVLAQSAISQHFARHCAQDHVVQSWDYVILVKPDAL